MKKSMMKVITLIMVAVIAAATLCACGGKSCNGYYTMTNPSGTKYALCIDGKTAIYLCGRGDAWPVYEGNVEKADEGVDLYFPDQGGRGGYMELYDYSPLHVKISDDGTRLYLSSDSNDWSTDTYDKVSKSDYETFIEDLK